MNPTKKGRDELNSESHKFAQFTLQSTMTGCFTINLFNDEHCEEPIYVVIVLQLFQQELHNFFRVFDGESLNDLCEKFQLVISKLLVPCHLIADHLRYFDVFVVLMSHNTADDLGNDHIIENFRRKLLLNGDNEFILDEVRSVDDILQILSEALVELSSNHFR